MNSSGIKRGLAATAVAALAVTGLPFLASSASAAAGDVISSATVNKVRNGGAASANIVLKTKNIGAAEIKLADQALGSDLDPNNSNQTVSIGAATIALEGTANDSVKGDGYDEITVPYSATTPAVGDAVKFALYAETGDATSVNADEARTNIDTVTIGAPASVDISTTQPATATFVPTPFTVTVKDAGGNVTQLVGTEQINVAGTGATVSNPALDSTELGDGTESFNAQWATGGNKTLTATGNGLGGTPATLTDSASITVFDQATISTDEFKFDTGADTWKDGVTTFGTPTQVRVDQNSVTFSFASKDTTVPADGPDDAGKVVLLTLDSASGIKFNGKDPNLEPTGALIIPVLLGADGKGSTTVALSGVTAGSTWTFGDQFPGSMTATTVTMNRASATSVVTDAGVYVTKIGSPTAVKVTVKDQFGNPIGAPAEVSITRSGRAANAGTTARVAVGADGTATINLPDAGTTAGTESLDVNLYDDQFDPSATTTVGAATINYTADGLGGDFAIAGATSDATANVINPLWDSNTAGGAYGDDSLAISVAGGTANVPAKVSVDNGAKILTAGETDLSKGSASETITLSGLGAGSFDVVGTKTGVVTVTIESAGRTKTVKLTVAQQDANEEIDSARNIEVVAPESANAGDVAVFDVKVTDAFGNPVGGFDWVQLIESGPADVQSADPATGQDGVMHVNVLLTDNANSQVSLRAIGNGSQFGSKANEVNGTPAPGLSASVASATASVTDVVNIAELQKAVDEAQEKVDNRQDALDVAQGNLDVALAEKSVAQANVKAAKQDLKQAKKKHKGVRAAKAALRNAQGDLKVANAKVTSAKAAVATAEQRLADAQAELEAAEAALEEAQN